MDLRKISKRIKIPYAVLNVLFWILLVSMPIAVLATGMYLWFVQHQEGVLTGSMLGIYCLNGTKVSTESFNNWKNITFGETKTLTYIVKNEGHINVTLVFSYNKTTPTPINLFDYISVSNDYDNSILEPNTSFTVTFMLHFFDNVTLPVVPMPFKFDIWITGEF